MSEARYPKPPIWLLVDGNNQVVTDAHGVGVMGAAAALARRMQLLIAWWEPACVITCWDSKHSWRKDHHPTYKAGRVRLEGIENAIAAARDDMQAMGVGVMEVDGFEADDLIATLSEHARAAGCRAVIMSRDKDLHQCLIDGEVCQLLKAVRVRTANPRSGRMELHWRSCRDIRVEYGVEASQWIDYQCLVGQSSDNIRGVHQVGPKAAAQLLNRCETLEAFFHDPWRSGLTTRQIASVVNDRAYLTKIAKPLCTLRRDVPLPELWREAC
jgi:DNA polymerase I